MDVHYTHHHFRCYGIQILDIVLASMCGKLQGHPPPPKLLPAIKTGGQGMKPGNMRTQNEAWEGGLGEMLGLKDWE